MFCHEGPWHRVDRIWTMRLGGEPQARASAHHEHGDRRPRVLRRRRQDHLVRPADAARRGVLAGRRRRRTAARALVPRGARSLVGALQHLARRQAVRRRRRRRGNGGAREGRQVAVPVPPAGHSRRRGNLGAERRRLVHPGTLEAERLVDMRAARLPAGAERASSRATANGSSSVPTCTAKCTPTWWRCEPGVSPGAGARASSRSPRSLPSPSRGGEGEQRRARALPPAEAQLRGLTQRQKVLPPSRLYSYVTISSATVQPQLHGSCPRSTGPAICAPAKTR